MGQFRSGHFPESESVFSISVGETKSTDGTTPPRPQSAYVSGIRWRNQNSQTTRICDPIVEHPSRNDMLSGQPLQYQELEAAR